MKLGKGTSVLVFVIVLLSFVASVSGIFSRQGQGKYEFKSINGQTVPIYGRGLYKNDSVSVATQAKAQDIVTLFLGIPLLISSLYLTKKDLLKGKLLLAGTLGYFLYTYASYALYSMYNTMFLVYLLLMSASFFTFTITMLSFDLAKLSSRFQEKLPVKLVGGFLIFVASLVGLMWLGMIVPSLIQGTVPPQVEHYTTLIIQALDLGLLVPISIIGGVLLIRRKPWGYLLGTVIIVKEITLFSSLTAMIIGQARAGVQMGILQMALFPLFNLIAIYCLIVLLKNIKEVA